MSVYFLEKILNYEFCDSSLLMLALTHCSFGSNNNERLEFIGDSVLNCVVSLILFEKFSYLSEGNLSKLRSNLIKKKSLYRVSVFINLQSKLKLGNSELNNSEIIRPSIVLNSLEAIFGAIFLDSEYMVVENLVRYIYSLVFDIVSIGDMFLDSKTLLQEYLQSRQMILPKYIIIDIQGMDHDQFFTVRCLLPFSSLNIFGCGSSKRLAEQEAAKKAVYKLGIKK